jgi:phospholipid transport system transporter-binding protein
VLLLPEALTLVEARDTLRLLKVSLEREAEPLLVVDGAQLRRFDSSALAVLLECRRLAEAWGKRFELHSLPEKLVELARLYGMDGVLGVAPAETAVTAATV